MINNNVIEKSVSVLCLLSDGRLLVAAAESGYLAIGVVHGGLFECHKIL